MTDATLTHPAADAARLAGPASLADRIARPMFVLASAYLLAFAGLIHRADQVQVTGLELQIIVGSLVVMWPVFTGEAVFAFLRRDRSRRTWPAAVRMLAVCLFPPYRLGIVHPAAGRVWLPRVGWAEPGKELVGRIDRGFGLPLLVFALLVVPVLAVEYVYNEKVTADPWFAAALHVTLAVIWVAFAAEFLIKLEASGKPLRYAKERWIDLAIVVLPMLEFALKFWADAAPVARLLRSTRAVAPDQLARMGRLYRLQGVLMKAWYAILALELIARIVGDTAKKRLQRLEEQIDMMEDELALLRRQADALRDELASGGNEMLKMKNAK